MKTNTLYICGNGEIVCSKCAGMTAQMTGRDIDGHKLIEASKEDKRHFLGAVGKEMTCECKR